MSKDFEFAVKEDKEVGVGEHKWYGKEDRTEETPLHDKAKGEPVVIRLFEFAFRPDLETTPTREQLITPDYLRHIDSSLWGDGLRRVMEPRVEITKTGCKIFVPCVAKTGQSHLEEPKTIQEWIK